jgi:hypothetical protein
MHSFGNDGLIDNARRATATECHLMLDHRKRNGTLTNADASDAVALLDRASGAKTADISDAFVTAAAVILLADDAGATAWDAVR